MSQGPYFHGGTRKLRRGDVLLPPSRTGAPSLADFGAAGVTRRDRVYIIDDLDSARFYALLAAPKGNGSVYEVEPIGLPEPDPDYLGDCECLAVALARVVRVIERRVLTWRGLDRAEAVALLNYHGDQTPHGVRIQDLAAAKTPQKAA